LQQFNNIPTDTSFLDQQAGQILSPTALGVTSDPNYGGEFRGGRHEDNPNRENNGVATNAQADPIKRIVDSYTRGDIGVHPAMQDIANLANTGGLDIGQLSSIVGIPPQQLMELFNSQNLEIANMGDRWNVGVNSQTPRDFSRANSDPNYRPPAATPTTTPTTTPTSTTNFGLSPEEAERQRVRAIMDGGGGNPFSGFTADGDYSQTEANQVANMIWNGAGSIQQASDYFGIPVNEIQQILEQMRAG